MDNARIATLAQLTVAGLQDAYDAHHALVVPTCYRDTPDFEELVRIEQSYVPGAPPPSPATGSWLAFVFSKPSVVEGKIHTHVFEPTWQDGPRADELWIKLKRAEIVKTLVESASVVETPAALVNRAIIAWATAQVQEPLHAIVCDADVPVADGPTWLRTNLDIVRSGDHISVRSPMTKTPLDAPPRFAAMHYMKVVSPSWALRTLRGE